MKNFLKLTLALVLGAVVFSGCDDDGYSIRDYVAYGTVQSNDIGETRDFSILLDNGSRLYISANYYPYRVKNNDRVFANFTILDKVEHSSSIKPDYYVKLNGLYNILSKPPVTQSEIDNSEVLDGELGNDPIKVTRAAFSGKYLNVEFKFAGTQRPPQKHFVNVVFDDVNSGDGKAVLTMRHNGYGDVPSEENTTGFGYHKGFISFDISSLVPEGQNSIEVTLKWMQYKDGTWLETEEKSDNGTFTLYDSNADKTIYTADGDFVQ